MESLLAGSPYLLAWAAVFFAMNHLWFVFYEEPGLRRRFGEAYGRYARNVPRWLPLRRPYTQE